MRFKDNPEYSGLKLKIAFIISRIVDPVALFIPLGLLVIFSHHLDGYSRFGWAVLMVFFTGILPLAILWLWLKKGKISDIDFTDKNERTPYYQALLFFWGLALILSWALSGPKFIIMLLFSAVLILVAVLVINLYWKISGHSLFITALGFLICMLYGWSFWWIFLLVPVVSWSRYVQKKHTIGQLVAGVGLGVVFFLLMKGSGY